MAKQWRATEWGSPDAWEFADVPVGSPAPGEVTIRVHAAGVNPADAKHVAAPRPGLTLPAPIGYEVSGVVTAAGQDTSIGSGDVSVGDEVIAFRIRGGYATELTVPARDVFAKPATLSHEAAANLLLAGTTAAEMLDVVAVREGETVLLHGASGAVGVMVLQLAKLRGVHVIGTAGPDGEGRVARFGGTSIRYGSGLADRVRALDRPIAAALDTVGTEEAVDVSLAVVADRGRIVTIAAPQRAAADGFRVIAGAMPDSARYRDAARAGIIDLAAAGRLEVPVAHTFPLEEAPAALRLLAQGHPGGKIALLP